MSQLSWASYDEVPYDGQPRMASHPDSLATMATLLGMTPAPVHRCRVLELGCGTGGNLLPMADTLPESRFLGIDLSSKQIADAQGIVDALRLKNIQFRAMSILEFDENQGPFDYIICHGVYSWVPAEVREKILALCARCLAPQGVAYISYNVYPGWHQRATVREMLTFHVGQIADPKERVRHARAFLAFLVHETDPDDAYGRMLRDEAELLNEVADWYIHHEHLEQENQPCYFHEFAARAGAHGLQYLSDAERHTHLSDLRPEAREALRNYSPDILHLEQYYDFVINRTFRRSLLCHEDVTLNRAPTPERLAGFSVSGLLRPVAERPDVCSQAAEEFRTAAGTSVSTNSPLMKAALLAVAEAWPGAVALLDLWADVRRRRRQAPAVGLDWSDADLRRLAHGLVHFHLTRIVQLHLHMPRLTTVISERPIASPLARWQAGNGVAITCLRHCVVEVSQFDRRVLHCLDGTRDRRALRDVLAESPRSDHVASLEELGEGDKGQVTAAAVEASLQRLASLALLQAGDRDDQSRPY